MFNDTYMACFKFGEFYYVLETFYCICVGTDEEDVFNFDVILN